MVVPGIKGSTDDSWEADVSKLVNDSMSEFSALSAVVSANVTHVCGDGVCAPAEAEGWCPQDCLTSHACIPPPDMLTDYMKDITMMHENATASWMMKHMSNYSSMMEGNGTYEWLAGNGTYEWLEGHAEDQMGMPNMELVRCFSMQRLRAMLGCQCHCGVLRSVHQIFCSMHLHMYVRVQNLRCGTVATSSCTDADVLGLRHLSALRPEV
jgi:hypothetical protein